MPVPSSAFIKKKTLTRRRRPYASALTRRLFTNTCSPPMLTRPSRSLSHSINNAYMQGFNGDDRGVCSLPGR